MEGQEQQQRQQNGQAAEGTEKLRTPEEVAEHFQVPLSWVYRKTIEGKIRVHKIGKYNRYVLSEVLADLATEQARKTTLSVI